MKIGLSLALMFAGRTVVDPDAALLFEALTTPPTELRRGQINAAITGLKAGGAGSVWATADRLVVMAAANSQASLIDWKSRLTNMSPVNAPTFTPDRGYAGDGVASHMNCGFNPSAGGLNYAVNSASISVWFRSATIEASKYLIGSNTARVTANQSSATGYDVRVNASGGSFAGAATNPRGLLTINRSASGAQQIYKNGVLWSSNAQASDSIPSTLVLLSFTGAGNFSANEAAYFRAGGALTAAQALAEYNAINAYMTAIGAA